MSGPAITQKLEVFQGVDFHETFLFFNPDPGGSTDPTTLVPVDFTGATMRLMVKPTSAAAAAAIISLTTSSGLTLVAGTVDPGPPMPGYNNGVAVWITAATSLAANGGVACAAYYDLFVDWPGGESSLLARGTFTLAATGTR